MTLKISDLLGAVMQSGMAPSSTDRVKNSLGGGLLGNIFGEVSQAVGGQQNLALGGLGALAGSLLGGGKKSMGGAMGGGAMALLGVIAYQALKAHSMKKTPVPLGLREPKTAAEKRQLEKNSELILKAMINAAKADGQIDEKESRKIIGKLKKSGADDDGLQFIMMEMQKPMETGNLIAAVKGKPELAAEMYTASLLAIEVDTPEERHYLQDLASGMGLDPRVARSIEQAVGVRI